MSIEYIWNFGPITVHNNINSLNNVVVNIVWSCTARDTDSSIESSEYGYFDLPAPNPNSFVELQNINKSTILSWLGDKRQEVETLCLENLNRLINSDIKTITLDLN